MARAAKQQTRVRFYRFRNALKEKLMGAGAAGHAAVSEDALARVEANLEDMSEDYPDWVMATVEKLRELHARSVDTPKERKRFYELIRGHAFEMKGQGGTFGFPLISTFAASLHETTGPGAQANDATVEIIKAHVDAIAAVIKERIKGPGGEIGRDLANGLKAAIEKHSVLA